MTKMSKLAIKKDEKIELSAGMQFEMADEDAIQKAFGNEEVPEGTIAGWASTSDLDSYRHVVEDGAFQESISKRGLKGGAAIKMLNNHNWQQVSGLIKQLNYEGSKLWIAAQFNLKLSYAADMYEVCKMLGGLNFSVGFFLQDYSWKEDSKKREYLSISRGDLFEVSVVPFPANEKATMELVKSREQFGDPTSLSEFEKALVAQGLVKSRNEAKDLTLLVRKHANLFKIPSLVEEPEPLVAKTLVDDITKKIENLKKMLSSPTA
jgi:HK97 family phage prohead protease